MNSRFMTFNFKLVYTCIVYRVQIDSIENLNTLLNLACDRFKDHINYDLFYLDYVIAGEGEMAPAVSNQNLDCMLEDLFGNNYKNISFYVRPMVRGREVFMRLDRYDIPELPGSEQEQEEQEIEEETVVYLPPPPGLTRVDHTVIM